MKTETERYYSAHEDGCYNCSDLAEAADIYHKEKGEFTVYSGEAADITLDDIAPDLEWISEYMTEEYFGLFDDPPDYEPFKDVNEEDFKKDFHALLSKYWKKPEWQKITNVQLHRVKWEGENIKELDPTN